MLDVMNSQLYRFTTTDGVLDDIVSFNLYETVFKNGSKLKYDFQNEIITIDSKYNGHTVYEHVTLRECTVDYLKSKGFKERTEERHELSYRKFNIPFTK